MKEVETYFKYLRTIGVEFVEPAPAEAASPARKVVEREIPAGKTVTPAGKAEESLKEIAGRIAGCEKCGLHKTRLKTVPGSGNPRARIMFVGEAPGADEDRQGLPFVGRAGKLLTQMIEEPRSLGIPRKEVFIANVLKCRPPNNRPPEPGEIRQCEGYLKAQIAAIAPSFICALGTHAAQTILKTTETIGRLRGKWYTYEGTPLIVTYHPSYLLRSPQFKGEAWKDLLMLKDAYKNKFPD